MSDIKIEKLGFTTSFHYQSGMPFFDGFTQETRVSNEIGAKYRVLVMHPEEKAFYTMKGMEEPMTQREIRAVLQERYRGSIRADEFVFEVYDAEGNKIFKTRFNAAEKPIGDGRTDSTTFTTFAWSFELPDNLKVKVKEGQEDNDNDEKDTSH